MTLDALHRWGESRAWSGPDPYEGLNARRGRWFQRTRLGRRLLIQAVKRSPLELRPLLRIPELVDATTLAHVARARARMARAGLSVSGGDAAAQAKRLLEARCTGFEQACWGYHFDVETRFFFYGRGTPNTIATAFAGHALLEAYELTGERELLEAAQSTGRFFLEDVGLQAAGGGGFFGYFPGDATPIHNASLLAGSFLARLGRLSARAPGEGPAEAADWLAASEASAAFAVGFQRGDGSWPYAEGSVGSWVDGFHTGYVLDALACIGETLADGSSAVAIGDALGRGRRFYRRRLVLEDGTPCFFEDAVYPIDGQNAAQAIRTLALIGRSDADALEHAWRAYAFAIAELRRGDGAFAFQRGRFLRNRIAHPRWVEAPMLEALAVLLEVSLPDTGAGPTTP